MNCIYIVIILLAYLLSQPNLRVTLYLDHRNRIHCMRSEPVKSNLLIYCGHHQIAMDEYQYHAEYRSGPQKGPNTLS